MSNETSDDVSSRPDPWTSMYSYTRRPYLICSTPAANTLISFAAVCYIYVGADRLGETMAVANRPSPPVKSVVA